MSEELAGELVPILIVLTVCALIGWMRYLRHQERLAAIQRGSDPQAVLSEEDKASQEKSAKASKDYRLGSLVLIAIGIVYMLAILSSVGVHQGIERAIVAAVWGIIPLSIGAARYAYETSRPQDAAPDYYRGSAFVLMTVGIAYMVCIAVSTGMLRGVERAVTAGVWGIIPLAIGVVLFIYSGMVHKERTGQGQQGVS
jgi:hypothetical protein